jgi:tellurite resistance protein TerC
LFWGIIGVIVMRGLMIGVGAVLIHKFSWLLLVFAAFLIFTGLKMALSSDEDDGKIEDSGFIKFLQKHLHVTPFLRGHNFLSAKRAWIIPVARCGRRRCFWHW